MEGRSSCCSWNGIQRCPLAFLVLIFNRDGIGIGYAAFLCHDWIREEFDLGLSTVNGWRI